jgi:hypothetical protein
MGERHVEAVLQRLDRLTVVEARITAVQTLEVVYGLVQNMRVVMDGEQTCLSSKHRLLNILPLDSKPSTDSVLNALGSFFL